MRKQITKNLKLYFTNNFPFKSSKKSIRNNTVTLGIGGNVGNVIKRFNKLFLSLQKDSRFTILQTSPILKNPPFGYLEQDYFLNGIIILKTNLSPMEVLNQMQRYEKRFKRKRSFKDAPRTLDIDIIFYNNIEINTKQLTIPHKHWHHRQSVLIPLKIMKLW
ncbi:2-amino-4-hydroxy-6-hydroxymethyldihydropteridinepyrophosphokinase [hydrothermal vent metagenome]|uniref:2-amino-4-hydroxy-6-hydroxymethyldihydropteridine diphosphokinase n=1 Tax=hydrothermal vent metagenome TaxID=652676 RepID=A0A3B1DRG9_9ZZZZ